jgi:hypothetical protein
MVRVAPAGARLPAGPVIVTALYDYSEWS